MQGRRITLGDPGATVYLVWEEIHHMHITVISNISSFSLWCWLLSKRPPKPKLAVKYDIIKSSGFFDYEESMNYSEATDANVFLSI